MFFIVTGIELGNLDQQITASTLLSPNFPNYPTTDTGAVCIIRHIDGYHFHFNVLDTWVSSQFYNNSDLNSHLFAYGILADDSMSTVLHQPFFGVNRFNRFINFTTMIGIDLSELRLRFLGSPPYIKFSLRMEGNAF